MKILIDRNVLLDYLTDHSPYSAHSEQIFDLCIQGEAEGFLTAGSAADIYNTLNNCVGRSKAAANLKVILGMLDVVGVTKNDLIRATELKIEDYADAITAACAKRIKAEYIVTRNEKGFEGSPVAPITPWQLLNISFI